MRSLSRSAADILAAAAALVERGWSQHAAFRDANGEPCDAKAAVAWCMTAAIYHRDYGTDDPLPHYAAERFVRRVLGFDAKPEKESSVGWNDEPGRTQQEVVSVLRRAQALSGEVTQLRDR